MRKCAYHASTLFVFASLLVLALTVVASQPASAQTACQDGTGAVGAPQNLRVDIADGTTGQLFVTWDPPTTGTAPFTYNVCRSTSQNGTYSPVTYCSAGGQASSAAHPKYSSETPSGGGSICRDDNGILDALAAVPQLPLPSPLNTTTTYFYQVQACTGSGNTLACGPYNSVNSNPQITNSFWSNTPTSCDCAPAGQGTIHMPSMQGTSTSVTRAGVITLATPQSNPVPTYLVISQTLDLTPYPCTDPTSPCLTNEFYAYHNPASSLPFQHKLVVQLPGSGSLCDRGRLMWIGQNLGFDAICVNYDDHAEQENICAPSSSLNTTALVGNCFTNISQAKLNWQQSLSGGGNCTSASTATLATCGHDATKKGGVDTTGAYYVASLYDSVVPRITTMLLWLCNNQDGNVYGTQWEKYLVFTGGANCATGTVANNNVMPDWASLIMGGWSQGGDMATFAASENPVDRVVNLSAPPSAVAVEIGKTGNYDMTPASYLTGFLNNTSELGRIYGLVSANDTDHYCVPRDVGNGNDESVYTSVWNVMGFTTANGDQEQDLNTNLGNSPCNALGLTPSRPPHIGSLSCPATSHNFVNWAPVYKPGGGHNDPLEIWNENIYEFMLID